MVRFYYKKKPCGCVVRAIVCGLENAPDLNKPNQSNQSNQPRVYSLGGHMHVVICDLCKKEEDEKGIDTLHNMWTNDNITNDYEFSGWTLSQPC